MLAPIEKKFIFKVGNIRDSQPRSVIVYADTVSKAVELFLQDYLKNNRLVVEISEQNMASRKI